MHKQTIPTAQARGGTNGIVGVVWCGGLERVQMKR